MTIRELRDRLDALRYPATFEVDAETLTTVDKALLADLKAKGRAPIILVGPNGGPWFKGVELLLRGSTMDMDSGHRIDSSMLSDITLRDYFAVHAPQMLVQAADHAEAASKYADWCYAYADAMVERRKRPPAPSTLEIMKRLGGDTP